VIQTDAVALELRIVAVLVPGMDFETRLNQKSLPPQTIVELFVERKAQEQRV
jgi:hypothetical protein